MDRVFLLDRSGSMGGWQIAAARRAIARTLDTLSSDDRLVVLAFDDSVETHSESPSLIPATDRNRWSILEWLGKIEARGGTEMRAPFIDRVCRFKQLKRREALRAGAASRAGDQAVAALASDARAACSASARGS